MTTAKRIMAMMLCILMVVSSVAFGSFASENADAPDWAFYGAKYSASTNAALTDGTGAVIQDGFTNSVNEDGGIVVHVPSAEEADGVYGVGIVTSKTATSLDNLAVEVIPGETFKAELDRYAHAPSLSLMFSSAPVSGVAGGSGIEYSYQAYEGGLRFLMPTTGKSLAVSVTNSYDKLKAGVFSDVAVVYSDGSFKDVNGDNGYRWLFSGRNMKRLQGSVEDNSGITKEYLRVDVTEGLAFEIVPDTTLGYVVKVNGTEYSKGKDVGFFPEVEDDTMTKAKADIDLSGLVGVNGYVTVGAVANEQGAVDFTVESINGHPAAAWAGEAPAAGHTHSFTSTEMPATCTDDKRTVDTCECGLHYVKTSIAAAGHQWSTNYWPRKSDTVPLYTLTDEIKAKYPEPTCTTTGIEHKICTVCGETEDLVIPALNHQWKFNILEDYQDGVLREYYSNRWGDWVITTPATATTPGVKTRTCFQCGAKETMTYTKYDDSEEILDKWYVSGETKLSRSNGNLTGDIRRIEVNTDGKRTYTTVNDDGSITVKDEAAHTGTLTINNSFDNAVKIISHSQSHLNGFSAKVKMESAKDSTGKDMYADSINFGWTSLYDIYCYAGQMGGASFARVMNTMLEDARIGNLWDYYIKGDYSFNVTLMDGIVLWSTYTYGTPEDGYYDVAFYSSIRDGDLWNINFSETGYDLNDDYTSKKIHIDPAKDTIEVQANYCYDEDEGAPDSLSFSVNGLLVYCTGLSASQSYDPIYHFAVSSFAADRGQRPAAFTLLDVCGEKPSEFDGYTDPNACDHDWGEYVYDTKVIKRDGKNMRVDRVETCYDKGVMISTCSKCEGTRKKMIDQLPHDWQINDVIREATCDTDGFAVKTCGLWFQNDNDESVCDSAKEYYIIPATGHEWSEWTETTKATCTEDGLKTRECENCGESETEVIPATGHQFDDSWALTKEPTCTEDGILSGICAVCGETTTKPYPATGHDWNEWTVIRAATEQEDGLKERTCKKCDAKESEVIPKLEPAKPDNPFTDIPEKSWYTDACLWCNSKTYMTGLTKTLFGPSEELTRAQFVQILAKVDGADLSKVTYRAAFKDVPAGKWYTNAIIWAVDFGVTGGIGGGKFGPNDKVTRAQLASFLRTYAEKKGKDVSGRADITGYADYAQVPGWAKEPMSWAVNAGLISSASTAAKVLAPTTVATRAQVALIIKNLCENILG